MHRLFRVVLCGILLSSAGVLHAAKYNAFGLKFYTSETDHFRIHYHEGLEHLIPRVAAQCEKLYSIYSDTYGFVLPDKTDFVVIDGDISNGWAFANTNTITIWTHDFDFNLRGSHDWFEDVITHEYAHIVSIQTGLKFPSFIPELRLGYFSHPNEPRRTEAFQSVAGDILPHWFTEGIAQYSSSVHGSDSWDSHRDMILRSLSLSGKLISWDHMQVFSGKGNDFEKTYNQGFSMVKYIVETYGERKLIALLRESDKVLRLDFDGAMKAVFGKSARKFYREWSEYLLTKYKQQLDSIGTQVYGKKINRDGYENFWPRFSGDGSKVYFLSNGKNDYGFKRLYTYELSDTVSQKERIKSVAAIRGFYDLHPTSGRLCYTSPHSKKSVIPARRGGLVTSDLFVDTIPPDKKKFSLFPKKTEKQLTIQKSIFNAAFSPDGNRLACAKRDADKFYLALVDTAGNHFNLVYPPKNKPEFEIGFIYSIDWSPDGKQIAFSYFDRHDRKIGIYDTASGICSTLCDTRSDERDPAYSPDGKYLYFSSDRTGIFNIYRYAFATGKLERITNVTGGAFAPSISPNGNRMVYAGYDGNGYGIYLLDSLKSLSDTTAASALVQRSPQEHISYHVPLSEKRPYSYLPRQGLLVPTLLTEQVVSADNDVNQGVSTFKIGTIFNVFDPLTLSNLGNELGGYFFLDPKYLFKFINFDDRGIDIGTNYDLGIFGSTRMLPLTVSGEYLLRGIAGKDRFFNETEDTMQTLPYRLDLQNFNLQISHYIDGDYELGSMPKNQLAVHMIGGMNRYDVTLSLREIYPSFGPYPYTLSKGYRIGMMSTFATTVIEPTRYISPRGLIAKLQYDLWKQFALKEENSFDASGNERFNDYVFHQVSGHAKMGIGVPWSKRHALHTDIQGTWLKVLKQDTAFPSYYLPGAWVPGYSYYFRGTDTTRDREFDTLVVTGRSVINGELSYRFPLSPKLIDKKLGFLYFERVYGACDLSFGAGWDDPMDLFNFDREDWLLAYGLELRIEAISFNTYPFDIKVRWDYGADSPAPTKGFGGHRFTLSIGYDFDNWGLILSPDYRQSSILRKGL